MTRSSTHRLLRDRTVNDPETVGVAAELPLFPDVDGLSAEFAALRSSAQQIAQVMRAWNEFQEGDSSDLPFILGLMLEAMPEQLAEHVARLDDVELRLSALCTAPPDEPIH